MKHTVQSSLGRYHSSQMKGVNVALTALWPRNNLTLRYKQHLLFSQEDKTLPNYSNQQVSLCSWQWPIVTLTICPPGAVDQWRYANNTPQLRYYSFTVSDQESLALTLEINITQCTRIDKTLNSQPSEVNIKPCSSSLGTNRWSGLLFQVSF